MLSVMRMAELSAAAGIPVATIKYYMREGILPAGEHSGPNQASYGDSHVRRLRLIRGLIDVGGLSVAATRRVIDEIDSDHTLAETFDVAQRTVSDEIDPASLDPAALHRIDDLLAGWHLYPGNPGRLAAARVLTTFESVGQSDERGWFRRYAEAALIVAEADLDEIDARDDRDSKVETVIVGTVLGDALFAALRRAAQEHVTTKRYGAPQSPIAHPQKPRE